MRPSFIFGTQIKIFLLKSESLQSNATTTFKAQKGSKDIIKIVHVTSVVQPYSYEAMWIFLHAKNTKITTLFNISSLPSLLEFTTVPRQMCVMLLVQEPFWCRTHMHCALFAKRGMNTYASWCSHECRWRLTWKRIHFWIKLLFLFSLHTKHIPVAM